MKTKILFILTFMAFGAFAQTPEQKGKEIAESAIIADQGFWLGY